MSLSEEPVECPLCMEPLEIDDISFFPCTCGYQICRFCWHRIRTDENGLCPACRKQYPEDPAQFKPLTDDELQRIKKDRRQKDVQRKQKAAENRKHLANVRVVQKNLVFVVGLTSRLAEPETLKRHEYFGRFGKIHKVVINQSTTYAGNQANGPSSSAYLTYLRSDDALKAIQTVNNAFVDGRTLKASLGTTKYCSHFLKGTQCQKTDCMYLHELGEEAASFTKEDMQQGKHQEYEQKLIEDFMNNHNAIHHGARSGGQNIPQNNARQRKRSSPPTLSASPSSVGSTGTQSAGGAVVNTCRDSWPSLQPTAPNSGTGPLGVRTEWSNTTNPDTKSTSISPPLLYNTAQQSQLSADPGPGGPLHTLVQRKNSDATLHSPGSTSSSTSSTGSSSLSVFNNTAAAAPPNGHPGQHATPSLTPPSLPIAAGASLHNVISSTSSLALNSTGVCQSTAGGGGSVGSCTTSTAASIPSHYTHSAINTGAGQHKLPPHLVHMAQTAAGKPSSTSINKPVFPLTPENSLSLFSDNGFPARQRNKAMPSLIPSDEALERREVPDSIPSSTCTDWQVAFGFPSSNASLQTTNTLLQPDDDLGFDPWDESSRALADLIQYEQRLTPPSGFPPRLPPNLQAPPPPPGFQTPSFGLPKTDLGMSQSKMAFMAGFNSAQQQSQRPPGFINTSKPPLLQQRTHLPQSQLPNGNPFQIGGQTTDLGHDEDLFNVREWQEGLRALLPNINISFGNPPYNSSSNATNNSSVQPQSAVPRSNPLPIQSQHKGSGWPPQTPPTNSWTNQDPAILTSGYRASANGLSESPPHWMRSLQQLTELDQAQQTSHRLPFVHNFTNSHMWPNQSQNPPPGFHQPQMTPEPPLAATAPESCYQ